MAAIFYWGRAYQNRRRLTAPTARAKIIGWRQSVGTAPVVVQTTEQSVLMVGVNVGRLMTHN